jgi:hypothetical protein
VVMDGGIGRRDVEKPTQEALSSHSVMFRKCSVSMCR